MKESGEGLLVQNHRTIFRIRKHDHGFDTAFSDDLRAICECFIHDFAELILRFLELPYACHTYPLLSSLSRFYHEKNRGQS